MITLTISELEVFFRVGVTPEERVNPQRLLITVVMEVDAREACATDDLKFTVDYSKVVEDVLALGRTSQWKLLEALCADLCGAVLTRYEVQSVTVEVRKFVIPQAAYVSARLTAARSE